LLNITAHLEEVSNFCKDRIAQDFQQFGLELVNFYFQSINIPDDDPSFIRLKEIKEKAAELNIVGREIYQLDRSMKVLQTAAGNEGLSGIMMQSGIGQSMGLMIGSQLGQQAGQLSSQLPQQNPILSTNHSALLQFYLAFNGERLGPFPLEVLKSMIPAGILHSETLVWKPGMSEWQHAASMPELSGLLSNSITSQKSMPPPIPSV
jgi:hypothetical protein